MFSLVKNKNFLFVLLVILLSLPAVFSLFHPGFFLSDDGNWMTIRFSAFYETLRSGQFPVRFLPRLNFGYGYPVADFLYPLFLYLGVPIHILGANFVTTIKIIFIGSILFSGVATFFWLKKIVSPLAAFVGAVLYVFFPYHLFDLYQRGSVGEVLALAIVPFILWQAERKKTALSALGIGLLILSHNSLAVVFLPFILLYIFLRRLLSTKQIAFVICLTLGLSAFFWIPALYDKQFTIFDMTPVSSLQSYFLMRNSYYLAGWITVVCLGISLPTLLLRKNILMLYFFILSIFSLFMALPFSNVIWQAFQIAPFFQFPFRFLSVTMLGISFLGATVIDSLPKKLKILGAVVLLGVVYFSSWSLLFPKTFQYYPDSYYSTNQDSTTVRNEYMPKWVKVLPTKQAYPKVIVNSSVSLFQIIDKGSKITFMVTANTDSKIRFNTVDFPGWKATVDGKSVATTHDNPQGVIEIIVPKGIHTVKVFFTETPIRLAADFVSVISLIIIIILLVKKKYER